MTIENYIPTEQLRPFIKAYKIIESQEEVVNRVLPDSSLAIAFCYKGQISYILDKGKDTLPASAISGLRKSVRLINYFKNSATIIVLFKETGASAFFKEPLYQLFEESVSLDNFIKQHKISMIEELLSEAPNNIQKIAIVENFLLSQISNYRTDKLILAAIDKIYSVKGIVKIKELTETLFISHDAFEKHFRKIVGTSPKKFSSIVQMKSIINQNRQNKTLTDIAFEGGYFDQSHFNKNFKLFTGQAPSDFYKSSAFW